MNPFHLLALISIAASPIGLNAQEVLHTPQSVWDGLSTEQRESVSKRFLVSVLPNNSFGTIIDAQSLNESTAGSNMGSNLGARYASAGYVDNAFKGAPRNWNYSATNHLTAQVAGALIGSLADTPAQARFRTRYTIRTGSGSVEYIEEIKSDAFRHTVGLCVTLSPIRPIDSKTCTQTVEHFLANNFPANTSPTVHVTPRTQQQISAPPASAPPLQLPKPANGDETVRCKFGLSSPVNLNAIACEQAGGTIQP